ncbi:hypothetical protein AB6A40_010523 [Gnathostoma spinigerum]|uniref:Uncharacterized protein n=1 Tax=Gnathostoma spinigerum TaxID=75299 RepID=A0ABD6EZY7_9BILA
MSKNFRNTSARVAHPHTLALRECPSNASSISITSAPPDPSISDVSPHTSSQCSIESTVELTLKTANHPTSEKESDERRRLDDYGTMTSRERFQLARVKVNEQLCLGTTRGSKAIRQIAYL